MAARNVPDRNALAPSTLRVRIGALSLPGAAPAHAARIGAAMRQELATLLAAHGASGLAHSVTRARLDAGTLRFDPSDHPDVAGRRLAQAIARALLRTQADAAVPDDADGATP